MGSNTLVKYLYEMNVGQCNFIAAISAGNPWDLLGLKNNHETKHSIKR